MKKQKCPKNVCPHCASKLKKKDAEGQELWECGTSDRFSGHRKSALCRTRCQVARLKKQNAKLKERAEAAEWAVKELQKTVNTLRNPNF